MGLRERNVFDAELKKTLHLACLAHLLLIFEPLHEKTNKFGF